LYLYEWWIYSRGTEENKQSSINDAGR